MLDCPPCVKKIEMMKLKQQSVNVTAPAPQPVIQQTQYNEAVHAQLEEDFKKHLASDT